MTRRDDTFTPNVEAAAVFERDHHNHPGTDTPDIDVDFPGDATDPYSWGPLLTACAQRLADELGGVA